MSREHNPQAEQMGDESMARNLAHQAEAIWPQEQRLFDRYGLSGPLRILDLGCGTGEITRRLAQRYPWAELLGVDILEENLARARAMGDAGGRIRYATGDAFALDCGDAAFDLVVCRHMSQAVPDFPRVLDLGCGSGEITRRLAERYPEAQLLGIDILESNLGPAREANAGRRGRRSRPRP